MKEFIADDNKEVAIITARRMTKSDYVMLRKHGIKTAFIGARDKLHRVEHISNCPVSHFKMSDDEYKRIWFKHIKEYYPLEDYDIYMYDDKEHVLKVAQEEGFHAIDAILLNKMLAGKTVCRQAA
jgi:3-deoxy-D-manno-octulosonate 8-phosphate phosphatase KdsC-like HAD superfamily phosphatase